jgi:hypothetical protein
MQNELFPNSQRLDKQRINQIAATHLEEFAKTPPHWHQLLDKRFKSHQNQQDENSIESSANETE